MLRKILFAALVVSFGINLASAADPFNLLKPVLKPNVWVKIPNVTKSDLIAVSTVANGGKSLVVAVGAFGNILSSRDEGATWTLKQMPGNPGLTSVCLLNDTRTGWVGGNSGELYKTVDGGFTWVKQLGIKQATIERIFFKDANNGYIVSYVMPRVGFPLRPTVSQLRPTVSQLLYTFDGGVTWKKVIPSPFTDDTITDIFFTDSNNGWITASQAIYRTSNGGQTWTQTLLKNIGNPPLGRNLNFGNISLLRVFFVNNNVGYISGNNILMRTKDGGLTWQPTLVSFATPMMNRPAILKGLSFADVNNGFAFGQYGAVLSTINGGITWITSPTQYYDLNDPNNPVNPNLGNNFVTGSMFYPARSTPGICGFEVGPGGLMLKYQALKPTTSTTTTTIPTTTTSTTTTVRPTTTTVPTTTTSTTTTVRPTTTTVPTTTTSTTTTVRPTTTTVTSTTTTSTTTSTISTTTTNTTTTTIARTTWHINSSVILNNAYFVDSSRGWAVGYFGTIINTTNGGITWHKQQSNLSDSQWHQRYGSTSLNAVKFMKNDPKTGMAVGMGGTILKTTNEGTTWEEVWINSNAELRDVFLAEDGVTAWIVGYSGTILKSINSGNNWDPLSPHNPASMTNWNSVYFTNSNIGFIAGDGIILRTVDGGSTWTLLTPTRLTAQGNYFYNIKLLSTQSGVVVGNSSTYPLVLYTNNGGDSWLPSSISSEVAMSLNSVSFIPNSQVGWTVGTNYPGSPFAIFKTFDNGNAWIQQTINPSGGFNTNVPIFNSVCFTDMNNGWIVGGGFILHTADGGQTWNYQAK